MIIAGSGGIGAVMLLQYLQASRALRQLSVALETMICEVQYKLSPLSVMCRAAARSTEGTVRKLLYAFAEELDKQIAPDAYQCMCSAIHKTEKLSGAILPHLRKLGKSMGQFDLEGQIRMLESALSDCRKSIGELEENRQYRIRSYQTLSICAGVALAVLLF